MCQNAKLHFLGFANKNMGTNVNNWHWVETDIKKEADDLLHKGLEKLSLVEGVTTTSGTKKRRDGITAAASWF